MKIPCTSVSVHELVPFLHNYSKCIILLYHAIENTAKQNTGKLLYTWQPSHLHCGYVASIVLVTVFSMALSNTIQSPPCHMTVLFFLVLTQAFTCRGVCILRKYKWIMGLIPWYTTGKHYSWYKSTDSTVKTSRLGTGKCMFLYFGEVISNLSKVGGLLGLNFYEGDTAVDCQKKK